MNFKQINIFLKRQNYKILPDIRYFMKCIALKYINFISFRDKN